MTSNSQTNTQVHVNLKLKLQTMIFHRINIFQHQFHIEYNKFKQMHSIEKSTACHQLTYYKLQALQLTKSQKVSGNV